MNLILKKLKQIITPKTKPTLMGRIAGIPNKLTSEVKEKLQGLVEGVVDTLYITEMTIDQKLKLLQITSQYILPRLKSVYTEKVKDEDLPLFMD